LDVAASPFLREELRKLVEEHGNLFVELDLEGMTFIDSTGIGVLVGALRRLRNNGGELTLANPRASAMRVLEIAGLTRLFTITVDGRACRPPLTGVAAQRVERPDEPEGTWWCATHRKHTTAEPCCERALVTKPPPERSPHDASHGVLGASPEGVRP
jgi:anti-anti-sigma factor